MVKPTTTFGLDACHAPFTKGIRPVCRPSLIGLLPMFVAAATTSSRNDEREPSSGVEPFVRLSSPDQKTAVLTTFVIIETNDYDGTRSKHHSLPVREVYQSCRNEYGKARRGQSRRPQLSYHARSLMAYWDCSKHIGSERNQPQLPPCPRNS